jgi:hypothetical protein
LVLSYFFSLPFPPQSWFFSSCAFLSPAAEVIGAVLLLVVQIGGAFQMFPAFPFSVR